ncbi:AlkZ family DNA glycosylase [Actinotalea ferrariae]|uniref:winged helix DNA-binding domain-containing protein n=1 Tax=Actinotalea ferrariae TaxID=1386098 RepID=UPI001ECC7392|nr:winged helix DNA-binding domain-containing protein [Actinotalea ferrariae]MBX9243532.1 AlkZ family DNA glycosylase [Actinotalea ferrariae]
MTRISVRALNRATLARQLLLRREPIGVADAVRRVVAVQAQQPASPYLALWNRVAGFDPAELDEAFADGTVVKATLMRATLHAVHREDHGAVYAALQPTLRGPRVEDRAADVRTAGSTLPVAEGLVPALLEHLGTGRSNAELEAWIASRTDAPPKTVLRALRMFAPLRHAPTGGPWSFGDRPAYVASGLPAGRPDPAAEEEGLRVLVRRYLEGFGPASVLDVARFTLVGRARVRAAVAGLGDALETLVGRDGAALVDVPGAPRPSEDTPAPPRLMAMWDSTLLAYADGARMLPLEYRSTVVRVNGDVLPTVLVDGRVAGVWRPVGEGIEVSAFHALPDDAWTALAGEARDLCALLAPREPGLYGRYGHWWAKGGGAFDGAHVQVLPA